MPADALAGVRSHFVRRWGEMGATWGISRTMAEVHALLFITGQPLCTDDVMNQLQISRGSASMNLRQLVNWGLIRRVHVRGDRKEYFVSDIDAWELFETITRERRRREVEPIIETIERCRATIQTEMTNLRGEARTEAEGYDQRLSGMLDFLQAMNSLLNMILQAGHSQMAQLTTMLTQISREK